MIVSISGALGAGKDSLARYLVEQGGFVQGSFGARLKDVVAVLFGWPRDLLEGATPEGRTWRETPDRWWTDKLDIGEDVTPRWALQNIGTEVFREHFHTDIWTLALERWLVENSGKNLVITDARFFNEFSLLQRHNAVILGVYRKIPKWLEAFYQRTNELLEESTSVSLMNADLSRESTQTIVRLFAKQALKELKVTLHESEIYYLLWNRYAEIIDNTGKLDRAIAQLAQRSDIKKIVSHVGSL